MVKFIRITAPVLLILWMTLIFSLSAQTAEDSSDTSGNVIRFVVNIFVEDFEDLSEEEQLEYIEPFQFVVRKGVHFTAYFIMGILSLLSFAFYNAPSLKIRSVISLLVCVLYSVSDEIHQLYIDGRSGEIRDVFIDSCGSMLAIFLLFLCFYMRKNRDTKKSYKGDSMRKKELLNLNEELFNRCESALKELEEIRAENERLKKEILNLKSEPQKTVAVENLEKVATPIEKLEEKILNTAVSEDTKYGAEIIGKIVVCAAKYCNRLTASHENTDVKELVNLILGRTEIAKAEILNITKSEKDIEDKKELISAQLTECEDYFSSIMGQLEE